MGGQFNRFAIHIYDAVPNKIVLRLTACYDVFFLSIKIIFLLTQFEFVFGT
jgi:hypothetical protein